jgi:hypothetical protein
MTSTMLGLKSAAIVFALPVVGCCLLVVEVLLERTVVEVPRQSDVLVGRLGAVVVVVL